MTKTQSLQKKAMSAMRAAVKEVVQKHKVSGRPLAIWSKGKVVQVSPRTIK